MVKTACLPVLSTVSIICVSSSQGTVSSVMPDTKDLAVNWVCYIVVEANVCLRKLQLKFIVLCNILGNILMDSKIERTSISNRFYHFENS